MKKQKTSKLVFRATYTLYGKPGGSGEAYPLQFMDNMAFYYYPGSTFFYKMISNVHNYTGGHCTSIESGQILNALLLNLMPKSENRLSLDLLVNNSSRAILSPYFQNAASIQSPLTYAWPPFVELFNASANGILIYLDPVWGATDSGYYYTAGVVWYVFQTGCYGGASSISSKFSACLGYYYGSGY